MGSALSKADVWVLMSDLFGFEGNLPLDKVTMPTSLARACPC